MLILIPSMRQRSMARQPSRVPGILIIAFGRFTACQSRRASITDPSVSRARSGATSSDTKPSRPPVESYTWRKASAASRTSSIARASKISRSVLAEDINSESWRS